MEEFARENKMPMPELSQSAKDKLMGYNYPGNVRELKSVIDLAFVMSNGQEIVADDIRFTTAKGDEVFLTQEKTLRQYNFDIISFYLKKYDQDVVAAAKKLDIGKSTIYKMIQQKEIVL
jgi:DNA-binding NtrC family response regulator